MSEDASESKAADTTSMALPEYPTASSKDITIIREPASIDTTKGVGKEVTFGEYDKDPKEVDFKMGKLAFYCENETMDEGKMYEMKEERPYEMIAMLNPIIENDEIKTELLDVVNESRVENNQLPLNLKDITSTNVVLGNYLKIEIKDPGSKFIIKPVSSDENSYTKKIYNDSTNKYINDNFEWRWYVTPKPNSKDKASLVVVISPLNKNKELIKEKIKTYNIKINFKQNFIASVWDEMNRNVKWAIAAIIAPILVFIVGKLTKKKENGENKN